MVLYSAGVVVVGTIVVVMLVVAVGMRVAVSGVVCVSLFVADIKSGKGKINGALFGTNMA